VRRRPGSRVRPAVRLLVRGSTNPQERCITDIHVWRPTLVMKGSGVRVPASAWLSW